MLLDVGTVPWDDRLPEPVVLGPEQFGPGPGSFGPSGPVDAMFSGIPAMMGLILVAMVVLVVFRLFRGAQRFVENCAQPEREVAARVVGRRAQTEGSGDGPVTTTYYATFEMGDGERLELRLPHREYGQLAEGDQGRLTHQGTWFRGFERTRVIPFDGPWETPGGPSLTPPPPH